MTRQKRKLHPESSSGTIWPWVMGVAIVLVLLVGIGLGVTLSGGNEGKAENLDANQKVNGGDGTPPDGSGKGIVGILEGNPDDTGKGGNGSPPPQAKTDIYQLISKNRVYLLPTTRGGNEIGGAFLQNRSGPLAVFYKALKKHDGEKGASSNNKTPDTEFPLATYGIGSNPIGLKADKPITFIPKGGTANLPHHFHLGHMTVLVHSQNPAKKVAGITFRFPNWARWEQNPRPWIHVAGKSDSGIQPFYLVPFETTRPSALIHAKVSGEIEFDDAAMTAKAKPEITEAVKKLLKENSFSSPIVLRAGAPLAKWGYAHVNDKETIDFKKTHLEPQKAAAKLGGNNLKVNNFVKWTDNAIEYYFPAAQEVMEAKKSNDFQKTLEKTTEFAKISLQYTEKEKGPPIPGLVDHKTALVENAVAILNGKMTLDNAIKKSENKIKDIIMAEAAKWDDPKHQEAEWNRFKQHPVFYLGTHYRNTMLPLIQFSK